MNKIYYGDNLTILKTLKEESVDLIYIDPPFNTGKIQKRKTIKTVRTTEGDRTGFQGKRYTTEVLGEQGYHDKFDDYLAFLEPRLRESYRLLRLSGSPLLQDIVG
jgi:site-specific DNA-methyltransferase (adenine-specific)